MRLSVILIVVLVTASLVAPAAGLSASDGPLADAGLDQEVTQGSTVYLDGGGSYAPDGEIVDYRWTIRSPGGEAVEPADPTAVTTTFEATELGTYEVTLAVTDDEGRSSEDTLYVEVETGDEPAVSLTGPDEATPGETVSVTAELLRGDAPLDTVVLYADGDRVAETDADPGTTEFNRTVDTLGEREFSVVLVDEAGQRATANHTVDVTEPEESSGGGGNWYTGLASRDDPTISGPQVVDGEEPLEAEYALESDYPAAVADVTWRVDGSSAGSGTTYARTWEPGHHELSAVVEYTDGTRSIATFPGGEREVLANPKPNVRIGEARGFDDSVSGSVEASDELGLQAIAVEVDGDEVRRWVDPTVEQREKAIDFARDLSEDSEEADVRAIAIDKYGQRATVETTADVLGKPTIVSAEFVNDPVDSYHERIDRERYAAKLKVVVDTDGVEVGRISIGFDPSREVVKKASDISKERIDERNITYEVEFAAEEPGEYLVISNLRLNSQAQTLQTHSEQSEYVVEQSEPEVRLNLRVDDRRNLHVPRIIANAEESFDPDGSSLGFTWIPERGQTEIGGSQWEYNIGNSVVLVVEDGYGNEKRVEEPAIEFYSPTLVQSSIRGDTYRPRETVTVETIFDIHDADIEPFQRSDIRIEILDSQGEVVSWVSTSGSEGNQTHRWEGTVEVPAFEFLTGAHPKVRIYNAENPEQTSRVYDLPQPEIDHLGDRFYRNASVVETTYLTEQPVYDEVTVDERSQANAITADGYSVYRTTSDYEYQIEKRHVQAAEYEMRRQSFDTRYERSRFLKMAVGWQPTGSKTETNTYTTTAREWRSYRGGSGRFTGRTRTVQTQAPVYRTEYRYVSSRGGSYWSTHAFSTRDRKTGSSRRVKVRSARYETQYQYRVTETRVQRETTYFASKRVQTKERVEEWRPYQTTTSKTHAEQMARASDLRIGGGSVDRTWHLRKETGTERTERRQIENPEEVLKTRGTVEADAYEFRVSGSDGDYEMVGQVEEEIILDGPADSQDILDRFFQSNTRLKECKRSGARGCAV